MINTDEDTNDQDIPDSHNLPHKTAQWDEVFIYALDKYKGNEDKALKFCRGWFSCGEQLRFNKEKKD